MFKFLKEKLKKSISTISEKVEEEGKEEVVELEKEPEQEETKIEEEQAEQKEDIKKPEKKGFFSRKKNRVAK